MYGGTFAKSARRRLCLSKHTWVTIKKWLGSHLSKFESIEGGLVSYFGMN